MKDLHNLLEECRDKLLKLVRHVPVRDLDECISRIDAALAGRNVDSVELPNEPNRGEDGLWYCGGFGSLDPQTAWFTYYKLLRAYALSERERRVKAEEVVMAALAFESWLGKVAGSNNDAELVISATDIAGEGTRERLQKLTDLLKLYRGKS